MAKLTGKERNGLPKKDFAMPGKKSYPVEDRSHAVAAKARASQMESKGNISAGTKGKIDAKADKMLKKSPRGK